MTTLNVRMQLKILILLWDPKNGETVEMQIDDMTMPNEFSFEMPLSAEEIINAISRVTGYEIDPTLLQFNHGQENETQVNSLEHFQSLLPFFNPTRDYITYFSPQYELDDNQLENISNLLDEFWYLYNRGMIPNGIYPFMLLDETDPKYY
jgi:hypothetical protein